MGDQNQDKDTPGSSNSGRLCIQIKPSHVRFTMPGAFRLHSLLFFVLFSSSIVATLVFAGNTATPSTVNSEVPAAPKPKPVPVEETLHGHKIADPFRWLENGDSAETQQFVHDELAYTRGVLDRLP